MCQTAACTRPTRPSCSPNRSAHGSPRGSTNAPRRWPNTANPCLFVNHRTAIRTTPTHRTRIRNDLGLSAQAIGEDRILHEAVATGGDVRRLADLFGLTVGGAEWYVDTDDEPTSEPYGWRGSQARSRRAPRIAMLARTGRRCSRTHTPGRVALPS